MKVTVRPGRLAAGLCFAVLSGTVNAAERGLDLSLPAEVKQSPRAIVLAVNEGGADQVGNKSNSIAPATQFEPPLWSGSNAHQYLGLGTIALAGLTAMTASEGCEHNCAANQPRDMNGTHAKLAYATTAFAAATIATGLYAHWDDFSAEDGWTDPDNLHVLLGVTGAALMAYAVQKSASQSTGEVSHAGTAIAGAAGMALAIKLTW